MVFGFQVFFGSGKSHLLKMLSIVLENKDVGEQRASDIFIQKFPDDALLKGELEKAIKIPSKSILFNIDQKATIISKEEVDALLTVFQSVFDEVCGYHTEGYIARLERDLDKKGLYQAFKDEFQKHSDENISWEIGRDQAVFESDAVSKAFASVTEQSETNILDNYINTYKVSIESFAKQVKNILTLRLQNFALTFLSMRWVNISPTMLN